MTYRLLGLLVMLSLGAPVSADQELAADQGVWLGRCIEQAEKDSLRTMPENGDMSKFDCMETILNYCMFVDDRTACFDLLAADLDSRIETLLASFPSSIENTDASWVRKRGYPRLLESATRPRSEFECPEGFGPVQCRAFRAAVVFGVTSEISEYIANVQEVFEELK